MTATTAERTSVTVDADLLATAARWAARPIPNKPNVPVLAATVLEISGGILTAGAWDYDSQATYLAQVPDTRSIGTIYPGGKQLADITSRMRGQVTLTVEDGRLILTGSGARHRRPLMPGHDYPSTPAPPDSIGVALGLSEAVARGSISADHNDALVQKRCVAIQTKGGVLTVESTDGVRISHASCSWTGNELGNDLPRTLILANSLKSLTGELGADVHLGHSNSVLGIISGPRTGTLGIVDAEMPRLEKFLALPRVVGGERTTVAAGRAELLDAVKNVTVYADDGAPVWIAATNHRLVVTAQGDTRGDGREEVEAAIDGPDLALGVLGRFLTDALTNLTGEFAHLDMPVAGRGGVIIRSSEGPGGVADPHVTHIVMTRPGGNK